MARPAGLFSFALITSICTTLSNGIWYTSFDSISTAPNHHWLAGATELGDGQLEGVQLFDLATDPDECRDRAGEPGREARMADLRNVYSPKEAKKAGFVGYVGVGRPDLLQVETG